MKRLLRVVLLALAGWSGWVAAAPLAVDFANASRVTRCAEEDNVYVKLSAPAVDSFRIRAEPPPYIAEVHADSTAPDFTSCDMSHDPVFHFTPRTVTLYEDAQIRLVGHAFASFWRPDVVDFRVGEQSEPGLHLVQLLKRRLQGDVEILVVYPADGYWRAKPLPPARLPDSAYGSSFLFGPIEESSRPFVAIRSIVFEPATLGFRLRFADGRAGLLRVAETTPAATELALGIVPPLTGERPFAALRSMFVTPAQADVAFAAWPGEPGAWQTAPILDFGKVHAPAARFGRQQPSRHNLSAPDLVFDQFSSREGVADGAR